MKKGFLICLLVSMVLSVQAQDRWQQKIKYKMDVVMNVNTNILKGKQVIEYTNNSSDTLKWVYFHLYWNAFQPNSMMDVRNRELGRRVVNGRTDWEARVADRIAKLKPEEYGYQKVGLVRMNGRPQKLEQYETVLKVMLDKPILPKNKVVFDTEFEAQVPIQIRRSGRDNAEGVRFSMAQWYPKMSEYDHEGWHPTPYIAREFYGVWGDFEVNLSIQKDYVVAATGYLQNPQEIGHGYEAEGSKINRPAGEMLTWKFVAPNVHDFVWAADPQYKHISKKVRDGLVLHAFYKISAEHLTKQYEAMSAPGKNRYGNKAENFIAAYQKEWDSVLVLASKAIPYMDKTFGYYPYKQYSFIQGGDGGMEYPMATLLKGAGEDVVIHEWMHSWYQMMMGTNESLYPWMDEGFTTYAEDRVKAFVHNSTGFIHAGSYAGYFALAKSGVEEPLSTHADHFDSRFGYSTSSYSKGAVFLEQLGYIIGADSRDKLLLEYYRKYRFKHPELNDFIRLAEGVSGIQLDWYPQFFVNSTKTIDYGIDSLWQENGKIKIRLRNAGKVPMPIDLMLTFKDGTKHLAYIPQYLMFGFKPVEDATVPRSLHEAWRWTHPNYVLEVEGKLNELKRIEIDPSQRMADVDRSNNKLELMW
ncbi:MAG: M1 family metallopeptidase [Chitinophagaceae bacterium]